jgi:hypothetical protein
MICPKCFGDYLDGVKVCVSCHVLLVKDPSWEPINGDGRLVHFITYFSRREAETGKNLLGCFDVDAIISSDEIGGVRLWINKEDAHKAIEIFQENTFAAQKLEKIH